MCSVKIPSPSAKLAVSAVVFNCLKQYSITYKAIKFEELVHAIVASFEQQYFFFSMLLKKNNISEDKREEYLRGLKIKNKC